MNNETRMITALVAICIVSAGGLSLAYDATLPLIEENTAKSVKSAQEYVMPSATSFEKKEIGNGTVFEAFDNDGKLVGYVVIAETTGFQGVIRLIFGLTPDGEITKVRILENVETPGLGSRITGDSFLGQFEGGNAERLEVDAITGATISSTAVIESVKSSLNDVMEALVE